MISSKILAIFNAICLIVDILNFASSLKVNHRSSRSLSQLAVDVDEVVESPLLEIDNNLETNDNVREYREAEGVDDTDSDNESKLKEGLRVRFNQWRERHEKLFKSMNQESEIPLRRITYTSKYLWNQQNHTVRTYLELKEQCKKYNLDMAEIRNQADFRTMANFLVSYPQLILGLGVSDAGDEGKFMEPDGTTPMGFQMFSNGEPNNGQGVPENCATMTLSTEMEVVMYDVNCDNMNAHFICQRRMDDINYEDSAENVAKEEDGLDMIGDVGNRRYYIGHLQKPWEAAKSHCEENSKRLLDFDLNDKSTHQEVYRFVINWRNLQGFHYPTGFWTSGQFSNSPTELQFTWQSSSGIFDLSDKSSIVWQWSRDEPKDQVGKGYEKCIDISFPAAVTSDVITSNFRASNCYLPFYYVCYEEISDDYSCRENGPMNRTGLHSKFLYLDSNEPVTRDIAKDTCEKWDYEMADLQNLADVEHLKQFIEEKQLQNRIWHLGLNDIEMEGEFYEADQKTHVQFQAFSVSQPDNADNSDCVVLSYNNSTLAMTDVNCGTNTAYILCQFQKETSCYQKSAQNMLKPSDELNYFGETAVRRYFQSKTQKTWVDAMAYCSAKNKKLLDLRFVQELNHFKNQLFYPKLIAWAKKYNSGVWTSGRFIRSVDDGHFRWESSSTGEMFPSYDHYINFTWTAGEPSDSTKRRMEVCIELVVSEWASAQSSDKLIPVIKASNCLLPNYFICYEDAPHLKNCHLPPKIDSSFKSLSETSRYIYVDTPKKLNALERKTMCQQWGLDIADISNLRDYTLVSSALDSWNASGLYFGLGINSVGSEGIWFEGDGVTPIKFQVFGHNEPQYYGNNEPLDHVVFNKHKSPSWQMTTISSRRFTNVLCQFKRDSECQFQNIFTFLDRNSEKNFLRIMKDEHGKLPDAPTSYFIGDSQQNWEDAMRFCWSRNKKLLDLHRNGTEAQKVYRLIKAFIEQKKLDASIVRFWTSGKYVEGFTDQQFRWETVPTFARHADVERDLVLKMSEPPVSTAPGNNRCLTLGLETQEQATGAFYTTLKASNCLLPYFFICYEDEPPKPPEQPPVTTPAPELKHKQLPPCIEPDDPKKKKKQEAIQKWLKTVRPPGFLACEFNVVDNQTATTV